MQPICMNCGEEMLNGPSRVKVVVEEVDGEPYKIFYGSVKRCPECMYEIVMDYEPAPILEPEEIRVLIDESIVLVEGKEYLILD